MDIKVEFISEFIYTKFLFNYIFKMRENYIYLDNWIKEYGEPWFVD